MILETQNIDFSYGMKAVLSDISLSLRPGEVTAVLGPNGAGKSTLINVMSGALEPSAGSVILKGKTLSETPLNVRARIMAVVAQETHISFPFTALEVVLMGRAPYLPHFGFESRHDIEAALHAMDSTDCKHLSDRDIRTLSGGERRRVIIARALAQQAEVLLLDEPTNFLDIKHSLKLTKLLRELAISRKLAVCAVMHDLNLAAAISDSMVFIKDGTLAASGKPSEIMKEDVLASTFGVNLTVKTNGQGMAPFCIPA